MYNSNLTNEKIMYLIGSHGRTVVHSVCIHTLTGKTVDEDWV